MSSVNFDQECIEGEISYDKRFIYVKGKVKDNVKNGLIDYLAACPNEMRMTASASRLPYSNSDIAFCNTVNKGRNELLLGNKFEIKLEDPGSYYVGLGTVLVPPTLYIRYKSIDKTKIISVKVNEPAPFRTLTYPLQRKDPSFYVRPEPEVLPSSEQRFKDSLYPVCDTVRNPAIPSDNYWPSLSKLKNDTVLKVLE